MLKILRYTSLLSLLFFCFVLTGQDLNADLTHEITELRNNKYSAINSKILMKHNNKVLLDSLKKYDCDTSVNIRFNIQQLEYKIVLNNPLDTVIKHEVISRFLAGLKDKDELIRQNGLKKLLGFSYLDFDKKAINSINQLFESEKLSRDLILLIGVANIQDQRNYLLSNVKSKPLNNLGDFYSNNWAMHLALARMGNAESARYCIKNVENHKDTITRITVLLSDISYIRSDTAVVYLKQYLYDNKRLPSVEGILLGSQYCQFAIDALANMIVDFPLKAQGMGYTDQEIETARKWMESQGKYNLKR
jgi:hypothetical protein